MPRPVSGGALSEIGRLTASTVIQRREHRSPSGIVAFTEEGWESLPSEEWVFKQRRTSSQQCQQGKTTSLKASLFRTEDPGVFARTNLGL